MANGSKNLSSMRSRRPQGGLEDGPIPAADLQVQVGAVTMVTVAQLDNALGQAAGSGRNGYATGNHKFLHLSHNVGSALNIDIWGYNYATQVWGQLQVPRGDGGSWNAVLSDVSVTLSASVAELIVIPTQGVDRIAFVEPNGGGDAATHNALADGLKIRAAFNTF